MSKTIGAELLRDMVKDSGLKNERFAELMGITRAALCNLTAGNQRITDSHLERAKIIKDEMKKAQDQIKSLMN